ncbi:hypothetical protein PHMEG_0001454 [Phytophthora megakarya]|uniref:Transmembrane protein n=1 Tax=Phytophthora megakarya TaxID=4795 RepID=A0A225X371_9STRA|nr:hypothetical protein PHMEG_0001454 [Phytophthora megakarya]
MSSRIALGIGETAKSKTPNSPASIICAQLEAKWNEIQVGRQGSYSVERLESFYHYCATTSRTRVALVCVLTPLPALIFILLLECLPLQSPSEGWSANWMFWIRMSLMVFTLVFVGISDMMLFVPKLGFTCSKRFIVSLGSTSGYMGTCLFANAMNIVGFPIPFIWQFGGLLLGIYVPAMLLIVFGLAPFRNDSPFRIDFQRYIRLLFGFMALAGVYPLYKAVYDLVPAVFRGGALIALPLWKFAAKHFIMYCSRELEDFMPVIVALSVDLFSALFVSVCISTSGSLYLSVLFIATDVGQGLLEFREVRENSMSVLDILHNTASTDTAKKSDLLERLVGVTRNPSAFDVVSLKRVRLWACLPHPMTTDQVHQLDLLETSKLYGPRGLLSTRRTSRPRRKSSHRSFLAVLVKSSAIVPTTNFTVKVKAQSSTRAMAMPGEQSRRLVVQGLQLLFHCEYLALVEYIECVVPLVFAAYKLVLNRLPNVVYFPPSSNWGTGAITNILVFAALEIGSLLLLQLVLQRKFDFSPLYQLAFALETQMYLVQASLFLEIVILLQYELQHLGVDFTFRFEWLRDSV